MERSGYPARIEGIGELSMGLAAAAGAPLAGLIAAVGGLATLWLAGGAIATTALIVARISASDAAGSRAA